MLSLLVKRHEVILRHSVCHSGIIEPLKKRALQLLWWGTWVVERLYSVAAIVVSLPLGAIELWNTLLHFLKFTLVLEKIVVDRLIIIVRESFVAVRATVVSRQPLVVLILIEVCPASKPLLTVVPVGLSNWLSDWLLLWQISLPRALVVSVIIIVEARRLWERVLLSIQW